MSTSMLAKPGLAVAAAAGAVAVAIGVPLAMAAPTAVPPSDTSGYLDSTARCTAPDVAVLFGITSTSRVAICKTSVGAYEYRGVRISDGAKLIASAKQTSSSTYVIDNDGVTYTVTPTALSITAAGDTYRTETWSDFHGPQSPAASDPTPASGTATASGTPSTKSSTTPKSSASATASSGASSAAAAPTSGAPKTSAAPSSAVPLPPPLPAEVGGATKPN